VVVVVVSSKVNVIKRKNVITGSRFKGGVTEILNNLTIK
jgi:hypothetical protein